MSWHRRETQLSSPRIFECGLLQVQQSGSIQQPACALPGAQRREYGRRGATSAGSGKGGGFWRPVWLQSNATSAGTGHQAGSWRPGYSPPLACSTR